MKTLAFLALFVSTHALSQSGPREFPPDSTALAESAIQESFSGKTYTVKPSAGPTWRWQFRTNGNFFFNTSDGFSDSGKWSAKENKLCTEGRMMGASCNEIRKKDAILYYKRDNGDIVEMLLQ
jgi:hypothetical protein